MKKWIVIAVLVAIAAPVLGARQTVVRTDPFGTGWTKQNSMNTELYQKTDPTETGFTGMDGEVITSGVVPSAKTLCPDKVSGVPSINFLYEENGTDTNGFGFLGPLNSSKNILYRISDESPAYGNVLTVDSVVADQTITVGGGSMVADVVTLILSESAGGSVSDDAYSSAWDGVTTIGASKNVLYDKISALETQVTGMIAAFSAAGLNSFSFDPVTNFPLYSNTATPSISVDVTDTSTTYAVSSVLYKIDTGEYTGNTMTNTAGNTWAATLSTLSEGSHDIRFQARDDKSTSNTGESAAYSGAIVVDLTNPAIGAITPSSLTHDGTGATLTATITSVTEANEDYRQWSLYDVTDAAVQVDWTTFTGLSISGIIIPADQHTYRVDVRVYDLAGNVGTASSSNIVYSGVACVVGDDKTQLDTITLTSSKLYLIGPYTTGGCTVSNINITATGIAATERITLGIYTESGGTYTLIVDTGEYTGDASTGTKTIALDSPETLPAGTYYLAFSTSSTTGFYFNLDAFPDNDPPGSLSVALANVSITYSAGELPATVSGVTVMDSTMECCIYAD